MSSRSVSDLIRIASAGGGFTLNASGISVADLIRIAAAVSGGNAKAIFTGTEHVSTTDLIRIGAAGNGAVMLSV